MYRQPSETSMLLLLCISNDVTFVSEGCISRTSDTMLFYFIIFLNLVRHFRAVPVYAATVRLSNWWHRPFLPCPHGFRLRRSDREAVAKILLMTLTDGEKWIQVMRETGRGESILTAGPRERGGNRPELVNEGRCLPYPLPLKRA